MHRTRSLIENHRNLENHRNPETLALIVIYSSHVRVNSTSRAFEPSSNFVGDFLSDQRLLRVSMCASIIESTRPFLPGPSFSMKSRMPSAVKAILPPRSSLRSDLSDVTSPQMVSLSKCPLVDQISSFGRLLSTCTMCWSRKDLEISVKIRCVRLMSCSKFPPQRQPPVENRPRILSNRGSANSSDLPALGGTL